MRAGNLGESVLVPMLSEGWTARGRELSAPPGTVSQRPFRARPDPPWFLVVDILFVTGDLAVQARTRRLPDLEGCLREGPPYRSISSVGLREYSPDETLPAAKTGQKPRLTYSGGTA